MRLIDADVFDKMLIEAQSKCKKKGGNFRFGVLGNIRANLALFPTVDHPEIVRCKDCVHWDKGHTEECDNSDSVCFHNGWCKPDWFCADGEKEVRRDDT